MNDIVEFAKARPDVNYRHFFKPSRSLGGSFAEADFNNSTTFHFQLVGREDAKAVIDSISLDDTEQVEQTFSNGLSANLNTLMNYFQW